MRGVDDSSAEPIRSDQAASAGLEGVDGREGDGTIPDFPAARAHVVTELIGFATRLRVEGVSVPATASLDAARTLALVGLADRERVADALRATLLTDPRDAEPFDEYFPSFWHRLRSGLERIATGPDSPAGVDEAEGGGEGPTAALSSAYEGGLLETDAPPPTPEETSGDDGGDDRGVRIRTGRRYATGDRATEPGDGDARRYSPVGSSRRVEAPTVALAPGELAAIDRFAAALATLPGRRRHPGGGDVVDARRALRASLATGGAPFTLPRREPVPSELRCCLLLDVSGSVLDTVDRATLLAFAERLQTTARTGRVFAFDDGFAEVTDQFERADGDPAAALREAEIEWGGGTRIGAALETLRDRHPYAVDRRTAVVVVSDGLDVGDPDALARGITWLAERAGAIVWLNPLAVSPAYEPRSRGMETCLPYVDALFGFAGPADVAEAARQLERRGVGGPVGYEHDPRRFAAESEVEPR